MSDPIPVVLDTDIGFDVDDVWALALLLRCPELDVRLILTENGDTTFAAAMVAQLLHLAGRGDIPIGIGIPLNATPPHHADWVQPGALQSHPGAVHHDGVGALIDTIRQSPDPVTLLAIGPLVNVAAALQRAPDITTNSRLVGMHGSLRRGYLGGDTPNHEYNVATYPSAAQAVFAADWDITITPLDTCGTVVLDGQRFSRLRASTDPMVRAVIENHDLWCRTVDWFPHLGIDPQTSSSVLYDTVAVALAITEAHLQMEEVAITVDDHGATLIDPAGPVVRCATEWTDREGFYDMVIDRLDPRPRS
ncbi:MAG: nucleoside hydrolase [Acidimicrobiia bacterium]|nr:nucleoside hydrolase [Acidimicrobiia bacterium]